MRIFLYRLYSFKNIYSFFLSHSQIVKSKKYIILTLMLKYNLLKVKNGDNLVVAKLLLFAYKFDLRNLFDLLFC